MFLDSPVTSGSSVICAGEKFLPRDEERELFPTTASVPCLYCSCEGLSCSWSCVIHLSVWLHWSQWLCEWNASSPFNAGCRWWTMEKDSEGRSLHYKLSTNPAQMWSCCSGSTILGGKALAGSKQEPEALVLSKQGFTKPKRVNSPGSVSCADEENVQSHLCSILQWRSWYRNWFCLSLDSSWGLDKKKQGPGSFVHIIYFPAFFIRAISLSCKKSHFYFYHWTNIKYSSREMCDYSSVLTVENGPADTFASSEMLLFWAWLLFLTISGRFAFPMDDILGCRGLLQIRSAVDLAVAFETPLCKMVIFPSEFGVCLFCFETLSPKQSRTKSPHPSCSSPNNSVYILLKHKCFCRKTFFFSF